ncbi:MAG: peroxide stress protein YaaA [Chitinophagaceae bacterium]|nr:peroxide stress protein YaaA [Chitinophagaceae bacterium]
MPTPLQPNFTFEQMKQWIFANIFTPPIMPISGNLDHVPKKKGIYFWFMNPDGYKALSNFVTINPIEPRVEDKDGYHLVYLGTAGTVKNGGGHLHQRIEWHITQHHTTANICHGTLSTFRAGVGSLISDDLILYPNSTMEQEVNDIFKKYFRVYWIEYNDDKLIDEHEKNLIREIRPLLNIKNNPNTRFIAPENPTKFYRQRRNLVYQFTRVRLGCGNNNDIKQVNNLPSMETSKYNHQIMEKGKDFIEISILQNQSIHAVINGIEGLPNRRCKFMIRDFKNQTNLIYPSTRNNGWRTTGSGNQNIYTYFNNVDPAKNNSIRWVIIQNEMIEKKVDECIIRIVVSTSDDNNEKGLEPSSEQVMPPSKPPTKTGTNMQAIPRLPGKNENICYLVPCASKKASNLLQYFTNNSLDNLVFNEELGEFRKELIRILENTNSHTRKKAIKGQKKEVQLKKQKIDLQKRIEAYKLYSAGKLYGAADSINWTNNQAKKVYIISALFGIIRADNYIPDYDLALSDSLDGKNNLARKFWKGKLDNTIQKLLIENSTIFNLLSKEYSKVFNNETKQLLTSTNIERTKNDRSDMPNKNGIWLKNHLL